MTAVEERKYIPFTEEMRKEYTILVPNMLPRHFKIFLKIFEDYGYKMELLETSGHRIIETGLKYVHNDTCSKRAAAAVLQTIFSF